MLPDEEVAVIAYLFVKPLGAGEQPAARVPPRPGAAAGGRPPGGRAFEGSGLDDCRVARTRLRQPRAVETAELSISAESLGLEYRFEGLHEAFDYERNSNGTPSSRRSSTSVPAPTTTPTSTTARALELVDEAGRTTIARRERFAAIRLPFGGVMIAESACRFEIQGEGGVGMAEFVWPEGYMEHTARSG